MPSRSATSEASRRSAISTSGSYFRVLLGLLIKGASWYYDWVLSDEVNPQTEPRGTSRKYMLRRVENIRPDLAQKVHDGELSAYAAAIEAGIEKKRFTVLLNTPEDIAMVLRRNLPAEMLAQVTDLLGRKEAV